VDDLQSEKEQIEEMKAWWAEYGRYVIAGVIIAVGLIIGFNTYKNNKLEAQVEASEARHARQRRAAAGWAYSPGAHPVVPGQATRGAGPARGPG
jgi:predicted negative regulator of RcsB-dependent stress response